MTRALISTRIRLAQAFQERAEKGQGTLEYVGMIALAALLVMALVGVFGNGSKLVKPVGDAIKDITGIGGGNGGGGN